MFRKSIGKVVFIILALAVLGFFFFGHINSLLIQVLAEEERTVEEHIALLKPFLEIEKPVDDGVGVYPVVIVLPGCLHTLSHNNEWHDFFVSLGYATVVVDSFTPRDLVGVDVLAARVCAGREVRGVDRAGDIYAVVEYLKQQPWADADNIVLAGWSHGGWAVMDALAFHSKGKRPYTLSDGALQLSGVTKTILFYPYCGILSAAYSGFALDSRIAELQFIAEHDSSVDIGRCIAWHESQRSLQAQLVLYDADHTFDVPPSHNRNPERFSPEILELSKNMLGAFLER